MPAAAAITPRPPLKWAGGKRRQVPHLLPLWEPHVRSRFVEPFAGGLAVTLGLLPDRALLNDANPHLINFYRWLQKGLTTDLKMENNERLFYRHRMRFNELVADGGEDTAEGAALFYYLNRRLPANQRAASHSGH
jgi:DNA adenine methylase